MPSLLTSCYNNQVCVVHEVIIHMLIIIVLRNKINNVLIDFIYEQYVTLICLFLACRDRILILK